MIESLIIGALWIFGGYCLGRAHASIILAKEWRNIAAAWNRIHGILSRTQSALETLNDNLKS